MKLWTSASLQRLFVSPMHFIERMSLTFALTVMKTNKEEMNSLGVQGDTTRNGRFSPLPFADHLELTTLFQKTISAPQLTLPVFFFFLHASHSKFSSSLPTQFKTPSLAKHLFQSALV